MTLCDIGESLWCSEAWSSNSPGSFSFGSSVCVPCSCEIYALVSTDSQIPWQLLLLLVPRPTPRWPELQGKGAAATRRRMGRWDKTLFWRRPTSSLRCVTSRTRASSPDGICRWGYWCEGDCHNCTSSVKTHRLLNESWITVRGIFTTGKKRNILLNQLCKLLKNKAWALFGPHLSIHSKQGIVFLLIHPEWVLNTGTVCTLINAAEQDKDRTCAPIQSSMKETQRATGSFVMQLLHSHYCADSLAAWIFIPAAANPLKKHL